MSESRRRARRGEHAKYLREVVFAYEGDECLIWPFGNDPTKARVEINGRSTAVSRLACEKTHGPAPTAIHQAAHSCGKGHLGCVTKRHLSWKTPTENWADRLAHGTDHCGEKNPSAKMSEREARVIFRLKGKLKTREIADLMGVSKSLVHGIHKGRHWRHITMENGQ